MTQRHREYSLFRPAYDLEYICIADTLCSVSLYARVPYDVWETLPENLIKGASDFTDHRSDQAEDCTGACSLLTAILYFHYSTVIHKFQVRNRSLNSLVMADRKQALSSSQFGHVIKD